MRRLMITQSILNRDSGELSLYLNDINRIPLIGPDEEGELAKKIRENMEGARDKLIRANLRFVVSIAKTFQGKGLPLTDLISAGNIGLIYAAERFDETRGFRFISYAVWWIRQNIWTYLQESNRIVRLPGNKILNLLNINKAINAFEQKNERLPTYQELSEETGLSVEKIVDCILSSQKTYSLDMVTNNETGYTLIDTIADENSPTADASLMLESFNIDLDKTLKILPFRQEMILKMFFGIGQTARTLDDISVLFNRSKERVRQLKDEALIILRLYLKGNPELKF
ncbi:RNA polymerase sigma factor RpoD/SigA [Pedobacter sp. B4-66]|uniref:sigma-70 family RNA polymerase sigma factor n=1 Tax=Pedobacter sp. B4-66 TaxID=2817280 RepID=UPI001BD95103|nr:RNA polymerase sigma factor RpoD/SigA [Pedobacter sp. B4-66]